MFDRAALHEFMAVEKPESVIVAAATIGHPCQHHLPTEFIFENLTIEANLIRGAFEPRVQRC